MWDVAWPLCDANHVVVVDHATAGRDRWGVGKRLSDGIDDALEVSQRTDVAQNRTIPTGTALSFTNGGAFVVAAGVTLTINGSLTAPAQHIFDGPGRVRFAPDSAVDRVLPQWFGAKPGGSADCTLAVQRAIESI